MSKNPGNTVRSGITSTVVLAQRANPRLRATSDVYRAVVPSALQPYVQLGYGPLVPDALPDGTIPKALLDSELIVTAKQWSQAENYDRIFLYIDGTGVGDPAGLPVKGEPDPIVLKLTKVQLDQLTEGSHEITFAIGDGLGDPYDSDPFTIIVDRTPPGGDKLPKIDFKQEFMDHGVTLGEITADPDTPGVLLGTVASYDGQQEGDTLSTFIQTPPSGPEIPGPVVTVGDSIENHSIQFTVKMLEDALAEGPVDFWYTVKDKAGNPRTSEKRPLRMLIKDSPDKLEAVRIPLFDDDKLIHEGDARTPIEVEIPQFGHGKVGDVLYLKLGDMLIEVTPALAAADLPADPDAPDPSVTVRSVIVPYEFLAAQQPRPGGVVNPVFTFDVSYQVRRMISGTEFGVPAPVLAVDVDLTLAGGEDPKPETPEDERLRLPSVSHSGAGAVPNFIPIGFTAPVRATIPHLSTDTIPVEIFETGDKVQLFRLDTDGTTEVEVGVEATATKGADLLIMIPDIEVVPGLWPFFYRVGRALIGGKVNWATSLRQQVTVEDPSSQPGGPNKLPEAIFRESRTNDAGRIILAYPRASNGTIIRIYEYLNMKEDDHIALSWQGNDDIYGTGADIADAKLDLTYDVKAADLLLKDDRLDDDPSRPPDPVMKKFVDLLVSYDELRKVKPLNGGPETEAYGSAWVSYTVKAAGGAGNSSETSRTEPTHKPLTISARPPSP